jgi:hypothetical protein
MGRDFDAELADLPCWDARCEELLQHRGEALVDAALQNRAELVRLCRFIEDHDVRSYLEIGVWTGQLVSALHRLFEFELVAACDHGWAERCGLSIRLPGPARFFRGDSDGEGFARWRADLGPIDLVLIDADHRYDAVKRDIAINHALPHRFLALHDITGARRQTTGVARAWNELRGGETLEIVEPMVDLGGAPPLMGIGIWSTAEPPGWSTRASGR